MHISHKVNDGEGTNLINNREMKITHMKGRMQTTPAEAGGFPKEGRTESENTLGAQTFMEISEGSLVVRQLSNERLLELIVSPENLNAAYKQVKSNGGAGGIDRMDVEALLPYLRAHRDELITSIMDGRYRPNPVRRVEIPKDNGKTRPLSIYCYEDKLVQEALRRKVTAAGSNPHCLLKYEWQRKASLGLKSG